MSYIGPGGHLFKRTVCLSEPLLHAQMALAKEEIIDKAKDDVSVHLDVTAVPKTTLADTVCQAHVVARLVSCVCLR